MIIITRYGVTEDEIDHIRERVEALGLRTHLIRGDVSTVIGCVGDRGGLAKETLLSIPGVEEVHNVMKPYKLASRQFSVGPTQVPLGSSTIGGDELVVIAGPCSVEGMEMLSETAACVKAAGAVGLRGGAFKPRSSPYAFDGLG